VRRGRGLLAGRRRGRRRHRHRASGRRRDPRHARARPHARSVACLRARSRARSTLRLAPFSVVTDRAAGDPLPRRPSASFKRGGARAEMSIMLRLLTLKVLPVATSLLLHVAAYGAILMAPGLIAPREPTILAELVQPDPEPPAPPPETMTQTAAPRGGYQVRPSYPTSARRAGIQGTTLLGVFVGADGRVGDVIVKQSAGHPDLDAAAAEAVKRWRFEPARRGS